MEILGRLIYLAKPIKFGQIIVCILSILGIFNRIVDCRHRDIDNVQFQTNGQKHSSQLASSMSDRANHDDGKY